MKVIAADHERRYGIPGVPGPARRPVDVDSSMTGFTALRSLRLYRFEAGGVVDGHAEEDEVFVIVTAGSVRMGVGWEDSAVDAEGTYTLSAPSGESEDPFVVYLPPRAVYQLTPLTQADVVYARSTPKRGGKPAVFNSHTTIDEAGVTTILKQVSHAERLCIRLQRIDASESDIRQSLVDAADEACEALVHVQGSPAESLGSISGVDGETMQLQSWDTLAISPGERPVLQVAKGTRLTALTVVAA